MQPVDYDYSQQKLVSIIHQTPVGVIEMDREGTILQVNAKGLQLLMPFFVQYGLAGTNLLHLFDRYAPQLRKALEVSAPAPTPVCTQERFVLRLLLNQVEIDRHFWITINKQSEDAYTVFFDDISELYQQEQALQQAMLEKAVHQGKFEVASGVLHDIGNAVVAFGSYLTRVRRQLEGNDTEHLRNLVLFFEKSRSGLSSILGETKTQAIVSLLEGVVQNQKTREDETRKALGEQLRIVTHIQEIIAIQRQYIRGAEGTVRPKVNVRTILNDCVAMQLASFDKRDIQVTLHAQTEHTRLSGDHTKLMQVFLNLLKNCQEALAGPERQEKRIKIDLTGDEQQLTVRIADNGVGFEPSVAETLFQKGVTSKESGSGLGLANCRSIIESHAGRLELSSAGSGQGATASVTFLL